MSWSAEDEAGLRLLETFPAGRLAALHIRESLRQARAQHAAAKAANAKFREELCDRRFLRSIGISES